MDFTTLKDHFDEICDDVNDGGEALTLTLNSGRKVFIMPEKNYGRISRFVISNVQTLQKEIE